jgi:hypothetical protein
MGVYFYFHNNTTNEDNIKPLYNGLAWINGMDIRPSAIINIIDYVGGINNWKDSDEIIVYSDDGEFNAIYRNGKLYANIESDDGEEEISYDDYYNMKTGGVTKEILEDELKRYSKAFLRKLYEKLSSDYPLISSSNMSEDDKNIMLLIDDINALHKYDKLYVSALLKGLIY